MAGGEGGVGPKRDRELALRRSWWPSPPRPSPALPRHDLLCPDRRARSRMRPLPQAVTRRHVHDQRSPFLRSRPLDGREKQRKRGVR